MTDKAAVFAALHKNGTFVVPNPWDAGTARLLTALGFAALATSSGGLAFARGLPDGANRLSRADTLANAAEIAAATSLPVTADLESGFGERPDEVAETIRLAAAAGLVGGSVEDSTGDPGDPIRDLDSAAERIAAAAEVARELGFTLTARAENFLNGRPDLGDTITRLRVYAEAGADVLYAPGLPDAESIRAVCRAVDRPVNVLAAGAAARLSVTELAGLGVRRISLGSGLSRVALGAVAGAAREVLANGTFTATDAAMPYAELNRLMGDPS